MKISTYVRYGHFILSIDERIGLTTDPTDLRTAIKSAFNDGNVHIAIKLNCDSYLSSRVLALLIEYAEKVSAIGGTFTVIVPNTQIMEVLSIFNLEWTLRTVMNEHELLTLPPKPPT